MGSVMYYRQDGSELGGEAFGMVRMYRNLGLVRGWEGGFHHLLGIGR